LNDANLEYDNGPTSAWEYNAGICKLALIHVANLDQSTTDSSERTSHDVARDSALIEAGYYLAKAESEVRIAPIAKKARHSQRVASQARRKLTDPIREAAQMYIDANPNTSKSECARWVAERVGKTSRHVERIIGPLFTPRNSKSAVNELRPKIVRR
jgi:hypothetical protein